MTEHEQPTDDDKPEPEQPAQEQKPERDLVVVDLNGDGSFVWA